MRSSTRAIAPRMALAVAVTAAVLNPGMAMAQQGPAVQQAMQACRADYQALCSDVQPGGSRILACLRQHFDKVSDGCKQALASLKRN